MSQTVTIVGAGITGISVSYHIGHDKCRLIEKHAAIGGHAGSTVCFGFTIDQGPHVSFTKHDYVRELFSSNVQDGFYEYPIKTRCYYSGYWVDHPAQAHLWQLPEPLRSECAADMLHAVRSEAECAPNNFMEWLEVSYGKTFSENFPAAYARKYWTVDPKHLSIDWLGPRMPKMHVSEIEVGLVPGTFQNIHYIKSARYPVTGGYQSFFERMANGANLCLAKEIAAIDLRQRQIWLEDGSRLDFETLVSTMPLPDFVNRCCNVPADVREAVGELDCSQLLMVDVFAPQTQRIEGNWFYVYDKDMWSTRIHCVEKLAPGNAPPGWTGVQVEVYFSRHRPFPGNASQIAREVATELVTMGFVDEDLMAAGKCMVQWRWSRYANVIFTHTRRGALGRIWSWLEQYGLVRRADDTDAGTDWTQGAHPEGSIIMAGRFAEWKYFWTDDCIMRGRQIAAATFKRASEANGD